MAKAASIKDAQFAVNGEEKTEQVFKEPTRESFIAPPEPEEKKGGRVIFKLVNSKRNGRYWMDAQADIFNPETKEVERARLIQGVNTIWQKEQMKQGYDKTFIDKNRRGLCFEDRHLILHEYDKTAIQFVRLNNGCLDNPKKRSGAKQEYYEWNPIKQEAEAFEREIEEQEAMALAMSVQPYEKVRKHASFLGGINFVDEMGEPRSEKGIRTLYVREARKNPKRFKATLDSKEVEVSYLVKRAILDSKIDLGSRTGSVKWANGGYICNLPQGRQAQEYLLELALLPNEEGKTFLEQLQKT